MDNNQRPKKYSTSFTSPGMGVAVKCPVEGCGHSTVNLITKAHLRIEHGLTKEETIKKYGYPEIVEARGFIASDNASKLYNSVANVSAL